MEFTFRAIIARAEENGMPQPNLAALCHSLAQQEEAALEELALGSDVLPALAQHIAERDEVETSVLESLAARLGGRRFTCAAFFRTVLEVCRPEHPVCRILRAHGLRPGGGGGRRSAATPASREAASELLRQNSSASTSAGLDECVARNLTRLAKEGAFDDYAGRPEIDLVVEILLRKRAPRNPILTGDGGIGKTAVIELLARQLVRGAVKGFSTETNIVEISMGQLVAGTKYRGEFEQRCQKVISALERSSNVIAFVDEVHLLNGAGRAEGAPMDASNLWKAPLSRGNVRLIGATTAKEYHQYIERDPALARRFQEVRISAPDEELTWTMVRHQADGLAKHHNVSIADALVSRAIDLTNRHVPARHQPDKSISLIDSAAVLARREGHGELNDTVLLSMLARQTGRPVEELTADERIALGDLGVRLKQRIIGQDAAVDALVAVLIQRRQDIGDELRNQGTFLFTGPPGVGKTELARSIAAAHFRGEGDLLHLDMAEYSEFGGVSRLIGVPPGYRDSDEPGMLIGWLQQHGSGVILLDEVEKAHRDVHRLLLGLLESGRITDSRGMTMDVRQCVVIMTTNALTGRDLDRRGVGFVPDLKAPDPASLLAKHFPREFLDRLDDIIVFNRLSRDDFRAIMRLRLREHVARLAKKEIQLTFDDEDKLIEHLLGFVDTDQHGAREIARTIERKLLQPVAFAALKADGSKPTRIELGPEYYTDGVL